MVGKKAIFFTIDAILAVSILLGTLMVITTFYINTQPRVNMDYIATDMISVLAELRVGETNNTLINQLITNGNITHTENSVLEQIGEFWAEGKTELAHNLTREMTEGIIQQNYGYDLTLGDDIIYERNITKKDIISTSNKIISGIEKSKPIEGTVAQTYLLSIQKKKTESYTYFGGFEGQGNITKYIFDIPPDANITEMTLELNGEEPFDFYINGTQCGTTRTPTNKTLEADLWDITTCNNSILKGTENKFEIRFTDEITNAYVGGGYVKIKYTTNQTMSTSEITGKEKYWFPGIDGLINLYSGINIPGTLTAWRLNLTIYNKYTTFLVIGNETVMNVSGSNQTQSVWRERNNLNISSGTIPLRLGIVNVSQIFENGTGTPGDTILSIDTSGSMDGCAGVVPPTMCHYRCSPGGQKSCMVNNISDCNDTKTPCGGYCKNPHNYQLDCQSKIDATKQASKTFIDIVLNHTGNTIGLNSYSTSVNNYLALTTDKPTLYNRINSYTANGNTCMCCGINIARNQLNGSTKPKAIVIMSDGQENQYCSNYNDYTGNTTEHIGAILSGQYACNNSIDVYTIAFGDDADYNTLSQAACHANDSSNHTNMSFKASNVAELTQRFIEIAGQIGIKANYSAQIIDVSGPAEFTKLYPNSSIEFYFIPLVDPPKEGEISINIASDTFKNCSPSIYLYKDITATDVKLTSYSSTHWTDLVTTNGVIVWNLSKYGTDYSELGDPFVIQIPPNIIQSGVYNNITLQTGDSSTNHTGCSANNSLLVFRGTIKANVAYTSVLPEVGGCDWYVEFEDGTFGTIKIPSDYNKTNQCNFTSTNVYYNPNATLDVAALTLLDQLDFDDNNKSDVNIAALDMYVGSFLVPEVPSMWGPSVAEVKVW